MNSVTITGGAKLQARLKKMAKDLASGRVLRVGILAKSTYPDGTPVAKIAIANEFGATIHMPARDQTVYRKLKKNGKFARNGRFVKMRVSNFAPTHAVAGYTITIPARPFFRTLIANGKGRWDEDLVRYLRASNFNTRRAFRMLGTQIADELKESIRTWSDPENAPSTIRAKGFNDPLVNKGTLLRSPSYEVK